MTWPDLPDAIADRLVALYCAARLVPDSVVASGASEAGDVTTRARTFEEWLNEAVDEQDRIVRRAVLLLACDHAAKNTPVTRVRAFAKELHHYVSRR